MLEVAILFLPKSSTLLTLLYNKVKVSNDVEIVFRDSPLCFKTTHQGSDTNQHQLVALSGTWYLCIDPKCYKIGIVVPNNETRIYLLNRFPTRVSLSASIRTIFQLNSVSIPM